MSFEPHLDLTAAIILFGILQAIMLAGFCFKDGLNTPATFLGIIMIALAAIEFESFLISTGWSIEFPHWINISPPLILMLGPLAFMYCQGIVGRPAQKFRMLHFLPALLFFLYSMFFYLQPAAFKVFTVMRETHPQISIPTVNRAFAIDPLHIRGWIIVEGMALQLFCYVIAMLAISFRPGDQQKVTWPKFLSVALLFGSVIFMLTGGVVNGKVLFQPVLPGVVVNIYCTMLVYLISGYWLSGATLPGWQRKKYAKAEVPSELRAQKLIRIREIMDSEKPYKDADFNLETLSRRLALSSHQLSQIINIGAGMSFLEFINLYRVHEAQRILKNPESRNIKVEALAREVGYQSKSAFFNAFKRVTQTTPARYRGL